MAKNVTASKPSSKKPKYKKLTNKEKQHRKEIREELRKQGILPPVKPRINRRKLYEEVKGEIFNASNDFENLIEALTWMMPADSKHITPEQVGVLKIIKMAKAIKQFKEEKCSQGDTHYKLGDMYEQVVQPIRDM